MEGRAGLIMGLVVGITMLVMAVIISFVIIENLSTVSEDLDPASFSATVTNETGGYLNATGYTLTDSTVTGFSSPVITAIFNATDNAVIATGNATVTSAGVVTNSSATAYPTVLISYTYSYKGTATAAQRAISNFTSGVDNVSSKVPTILLIAAVVLVLGILALLWLTFKKTDLIGSTGL